MALQAQYPANLVLVNRAEAERNGKDIEMELPHPPLFEQSAAVFCSNGDDHLIGNANPRKRGRGPATTVVGKPFEVAPPPQQQKFFSLQAQPAMQAAL
ncbi:hypothetical protein HPP92_014649 [Vanilla planifolia]|uniref:Uncharacterized protein n=1 Tax=Vanilla planifolia TaxID=51239 RepID=A0A835USX4_VANPL|nr:hypothetical protein HPP92_014649 [Vanilla planifolia]